MRKFIWILGILVVVSCARLDDIAFVNDNTIEAYLYDDCYLRFAGRPYDTIERNRPG